MNKKVEENLDTEAVNVKDHRDELIKLRLVSNTRILYVIGDQTILMTTFNREGNTEMVKEPSKKDMSVMTS